MNLPESYARDIFFFETRYNSNICRNRHDSKSRLCASVPNCVSDIFRISHPLPTDCTWLWFFVFRGSCHDREIYPDTPSSCILNCCPRPVDWFECGASEKEWERERKRCLKPLLAEQESSLFVPHAISGNDTWAPLIITVIPWCCDTTVRFDLIAGH